MTVEPAESVPVATLERQGDAESRETRFVLDRDGDLWMTVGPSLWKCLTTDSCLVAGSDLVNVCGPLVELRSERRIRESIAGEIEAEGVPDHAWTEAEAQSIRQRYFLAAARIARGSSS